MTIQESYRIHLQQIVQSVFDTMLQIQVDPSKGRFDTDDSDILTLVQITGDWMGTVVLAMPAVLMMETTSVMLQMPIDDIEDQDICDVAAELVNVIGGNFKSVLNVDSGLSLPSITTGKDMRYFVLGATHVERVDFEANCSNFHVSIFEKDPSQN